MHRLFVRIAAMALAIVACGAPTWAQFGKNKISYENFDWHVYKSPHFDVHYYPEEEAFLEDIVSYAESAYLRASQELDHEPKFRIPLIIYKTHGEFQQTNVTMATLPDGVGAFAEPVQYRMVVPIDEPPDKLYALIAHELVHIFEYSLFYDGYLGRAIRGRAPLWLMEGLASYIGQDEDSLDQMVIRDAVVNNIIPPIQSLNVLSFLTYRYGHAVFDYIEQEHGKEGLRSFLFEMKKVLLTGNLGKAVKEAFGYNMEEFNRRFNRYLRKKYFPVLLEKKSPDEYGAEIAFSRKGPFTFAPTLSPSGQLIAALSAPKMELDLIVVSAEDGTLVKNLTKGWTNKYTGLVAEGFAGRRDLSWSPVADEIALFARRENRWPLLVIDALSGKFKHDIVFDDIFQCASPAFSPDGRRVAFEGNQNGIVEIFEVDLETKEVRNLTQDEFFDTNPWYSADGRTVLYNRRIGKHWKIFSVDVDDPSRKTQLTFGTFSDLQPAYSRDGKTIFFTSDRGPYGVFNLHSLDLVSGDVRQYTDVVGGCFTPVEMAPRDDEQHLAFSAFFEGRFRLYRMPLLSPELQIPVEERMALPAEAEPFEPDLALSIDEDKKQKYKLKWDIEAPSLTIGVADDGTILGNIAVQFTDLLGNHRVFVMGGSVDDVTSYDVTYLNLKHRYNWGVSYTDFSDYFVEETTGIRLRREYSWRGLSAFIDYPLNRYYRVEGSVSVAESSNNQLAGVDDNGTPLFANLDDRRAYLMGALVGDTTRFQSFGAFQGKRFRLSARYGKYISGEFPGDIMEYRLDFRTYKQITRRSVLAYRFSTIINTGEQDNIYGLGGLNQLRGYEFRSFYGSQLFWSNLEFRFPLVDVMRFPIFALQQIRGVVFFDVGGAWYQDDLWYDPLFNRIRADYSQNPPETVPFKIWDSDNGRFQDARGSYGVGFNFLFIGGLQFNWVWAQRLPHTQFLYNPDGSLYKVKADDTDTRSEFYIQWDF